MANRFHASTATKIRNVIQDLMVGLGVEVDFQYAPGFALQLQVNDDGQSISVRGRPTGQGNSNPFGTEVNGVKQSTPPKIVQVTSLPVKFGAVVETDSTKSATGVLAAGVNASIALASAAGDRFLVYEVTAGGTAANHFSVYRVNATTVSAFAHQVSGAVQTGNTSTIRVVNLGQAA